MDRTEGLVQRRRQPKVEENNDVVDDDREEEEERVSIFDTKVITLYKKHMSYINNLSRIVIVRKQD